MRKKDVARRPGAAGRQRARDVAKRVRRARVLGDAVVVPGDRARVRVDDDVLEDGAEADGLEDLRLGLLRKADDLGVAAALEVEDAMVAPAVLVVADQPAGRVGRQSRLARPGEPEVQGDVPHVAGRCRAVHRQHAALGEEVVHHREQRLLHLSAVHCAEDQDEATTEGDADKDRAVAQLFRRGGGEGAAVDDGEGRREPLEVHGLGAHEERAARTGRASLRRRPRGWEPVGGLGADEAVEHGDVTGAQVAARMLELALEDLGAAGLVGAAPGDVGGGVVLHDVAVVRGAAGACPGGHDERAVGGQDALAARQGPSYELGDGEIAVDPADREAVGGELSLHHLLLQRGPPWSV